MNSQFCGQMPWQDQHRASGCRPRAPAPTPAVSALQAPAGRSVCPAAVLSAPAPSPALPAAAPAQGGQACRGPGIPEVRYTGQLLERAFQIRAVSCYAWGLPEDSKTSLGSHFKTGLAEAGVVLAQPKRQSLSTSVIVDHKPGNLDVGKAV